MGVGSQWFRTTKTEENYRESKRDGVEITTTIQVLSLSKNRRTEVTEGQLGKRFDVDVT